MRLSLAAIVAASSALVLASTCGKKAEGPPPAPPEVLVTPVVQQDVPVTKEWIGTLEGSVDAEIRSKVQGYVLRRAYEEGSFVRKGTLLFEVDPRQFQAAFNQASGSVARAEAQLAKTRQDVERYTPLAAQKAISQQELDNAISARDEAIGALAAAKASADQSQLNVEWSRVTSPIDGITGIAQVQVGDLVDGQRVLTSVSSVDPIRVRFSISEQEYMRSAAKLNAEANRAASTLELELVLADGSVFAQKGRPIVLNRQVDVKTGTISILGEFPNPGNLLRPGQYAKVRAVVDLRKGALCIPQRAVSELQGNYMVGVVKPDGTAEMRAVVAGPRFGSLWVIEKGLEAGDQVVVEGLQLVRSGGKVTAKQAPASDAAPAPKAS
jgi:membrane fusion protein (multidrug efflux system)